MAAYSTYGTRGQLDIALADFFSEYTEPRLVRRKGQHDQISIQPVNHMPDVGVWCEYIIALIIEEILLCTGNNLAVQHNTAV